MTNSHSH